MLPQGHLGGPLGYPAEGCSPSSPQSLLPSTYAAAKISAKRATSNATWRIDPVEPAAGPARPGDGACRAVCSRRSVGVGRCSTVSASPPGYSVNAPVPASGRFPGPPSSPSRRSITAPAEPARESRSFAIAQPTARSKAGVEPGDELPRRRHRIVAMGEELRRRVVPWVGHLAGERPVQGAAEGVNVNAGVDAAFSDLLGRHVVEGPEQPSGLGARKRGLDPASETEVGEVGAKGPSPILDQHVRGLHVPVDEPGRVGGIERPRRAG